MLLVDLGADTATTPRTSAGTFPVSGKFTEEQKIYYNAVLYGQQKVLEYLAPGKPVGGHAARGP